MIAIKGHYGGQKVILPEHVRGVSPGDMILIFEHAQESQADHAAWMRASEAAFATASARRA